MCGQLLRAYGRTPAVYGLALNVVSSVGIIVINKVLFTLQFQFGVPTDLTRLCHSVDSASPAEHTCDIPCGGGGVLAFAASTLLGLNFAATSVLALCPQETRSKRSPELAPGADAAVLSSLDMSKYIVCFVLSLIGGQFSLMLNSVGFYQVSKLMMIPTSCVFEFFLQGRRFSPPMLACIALLLFGVGLTTVSDVSMRPLGTFMAAIGVVTSSGQQVLVSFLQKKYNFDVAVFVASSSQYVAITLLTIGPFLDRYVSGLWVADWLLDCPNPRLIALLVFCSSTIAALVNWSQAVAIVHTSAVCAWPRRTAICLDRPATRSRGHFRDAPPEMYLLVHEQ